MTNPIYATLAGLTLALPLTAMAEQHTLPEGEVVLSPDTQAFIDSIADAPPINTLPPEEARQVLIDTQTGADVEMPAASVEEMTLDIGPTGSVTVHVVRPDGTEGETLPGVVYFHGGGWILGNFTTHERLIRELADQSGAAMVFVDYAPAPEQKHPVQLEQDFAVLQHVAENAGEYGIDPERLALAGDSVGGQMVAVVAQMAKEDGPELDAIAMLYPVTTANLTSESYELFADGPWLSKASMEWFWDAYLPEDADASDPMISPLNDSEDELADLPPALVITDANDVLRDEGEAFAAKLVRAGVPTEQARYEFTMHDFMMLNPLAKTPATEAAIEQTAGFLRDHLSAE
ncbi:alpha/beta hydrolase [uncultured Jannaschia sp.]|uniref:alpha/beta hydrolase n=1 Tax=uncultured Jannaschia sp. TaxID=293347 RepID=UPI002605FD6A|nr:alpha/beta hydrolase [uncultured Jannaschia sp.]